MGAVKTFIHIFNERGCKNQYIDRIQVLGPLNVGDPLNTGLLVHMDDVRIIV